MSKSGNLLVCGNDNKEVEIWNYLECIKLVTLTGHSDIVSGVCFSNDS